MTIASPPLVGVSTCVKDLNGFPFHATNQRYLIALSEICGALPMLIPALGARIDPADLAARLDGLVLTGSPSNVEPFHYDSEPAAPDILKDPARDATSQPATSATPSRRASTCVSISVTEVSVTSSSMTAPG